MAVSCNASAVSSRRRQRRERKPPHDMRRQVDSGTSRIIGPWPALRVPSPGSLTSPLPLGSVRTEIASTELDAAPPLFVRDLLPSEMAFAMDAATSCTPFWRCGLEGIMGRIGGSYWTRAALKSALWDRTVGGNRVRPAFDWGPLERFAVAPTTDAARLTLTPNLSRATPARPHSARSRRKRTSEPGARYSSRGSRS
jgi:hypothetical protein